VTSPVLDRRSRLVASAEGVSGARRFVRAALDAVGAAPDQADVAVLLVSEVASNAVLHARTSIEVRVMAADGWIRLEVRDGSRVLPSISDHDGDGMTGRGLVLVASLASSWGARPDPAGKVVWFEVGAPPANRWATESSDPALGYEPSEVVRLIGAPPALVVAALAHGDALLREVSLSSAAEAPEGAMPAASPLDLRPVLRAAEAAVAVGRTVIDIEERYPLSAAVAAAHRRTLVDQGRRAADMGIYLTAPAPVEVDRCLRWVLDEISGQLTGRPPSPWKRSADEAPVHRPVAGFTAPVAAVGMLVADQSGEIVHVSETAAHMLGWEADDLVGRRVTTIIPPASREAHVDAFTRFQLGGPARILGETRRVQALRKDGSLIDVDLTVNALDRRGGERAVIAALEEVLPDVPAADESIGSTTGEPAESC
jgi:PAS domain S-box-containing protein